MSQAYQPLHHKYRPDCFDDLVGQEAIATTLKQALISNRIAPAYLFSGPRGTGKTSSARILSRSLNCLNSEQPTTNPCGKCDLCTTISSGTSLDVIEIDAASNTGVDNIRELIERSRFAPVQARWKVYVIDECHMLSTAAFNALLKTLEEPPSRVVFILATTDPQRVLPTILSRCQRFDFRRIPLQALTKHLGMIASKEAIEIEKEAIQLVAQRAQGGLRDAESMLDQLSLLPQPIHINSVWDLLGAIPEQELLILISALANSKPIILLETCRNLLNRGREPIVILQDMAAIMRDLIIIKAAPDRPELTSISYEFKSKLSEIASQITLEKLYQWQSKLKGSEIQLRQSSQPPLWLEVLLLGILADTNNSPNPINQVVNNKDLEAKSQIKQHQEKNKLVETEVIKQIGNTDNTLTKAQEIEESNNENLSELWQQILGSLELPSTKMLLSQQAKLIDLTSKKAIIEVSTNWMSMVQSRISLLEQAITQTIGSPRKLILKETMESGNNNSNNLKKNISIQSNSVLNKSNNPENNFKGNAINNVAREKHVNNITSTEGSNEPDQISENIEPIDKKAKQLAEFFNGKVLDSEP